MDSNDGSRLGRPLREYADGYVLVVEDDDILREGLVDLVEQDGFRAEGVANGRAALDHLSASAAPPRLILLDLMMPIMDGWELLNNLRLDETFASIPLVILSAYTSRSSPPNQGVPIVRVMEKPIDIPLLRELVAKAMAAPYPTQR